MLRVARIIVPDLPRNVMQRPRSVVVPYSLLATVVMLTLMPGCYRSFILDLDDIGGFESEYSQESETLRISGLAMHSSYSVTKISTKQIDSDLIVEIKLGRPRKGLSGSFDHTLDVPSTVERVLLGKERKEIWHRTH